MSDGFIEAIRSLPPGKRARGSRLTVEEWAEIAEQYRRGVTLLRMFEVLCKGRPGTFKTIQSFTNAFHQAERMAAKQAKHA